ncbi:hypothetical protein [Aeromonas dhakensis]|uniref:hypothetical protein n=1 Tax=Aeromonas dhakensis TaxID=196024 RepID=UPI002441F3D3|nr:hypothetical protein [Aeromonas dhakensis]
MKLWDKHITMGGGDPRLFVDYASGYFYMFYTSRVQNLSGWSGFSSFMQEHVMRAPISGKMSPDSWRKYHNGKWEKYDTQDYSLGNAGAASNIVSVDVSPKGYFTPEYNPETMSGTASELTSQGKLINSPPKSHECCLEQLFKQVHCNARAKFGGSKREKSTNGVLCDRKLNKSEMEKKYLP